MSLCPHGAIKALHSEILPSNAENAQHGPMIAAFRLPIGRSWMIPRNRARQSVTGAWQRRTWAAALRVARRRSV